MKKKWLLGILSGLCVATCALGLAACNGSGDPSGDTEMEQIYTQYVSYTQAQGGEPLSYEEWLDFIKGEKGDDGKSAYQIWLEAGHIGNESDFLNWLKGEDGQDGTNGQNGKSAYEIWLDAGHQGDEEDFLNWLKGETVCEHGWSDWWQLVPGGCNTKGYRVRECSLCGEDEAEIQPPAHTYGTERSSDDTHHWKQCTVSGCDSIDEKEEHDFVDEACTVCGASLDKVIHVAYQLGGYGSGFMEQWKAEFEAMYPEYEVYLEGTSSMTWDFETRLATGRDVPDVFLVLETGWQKQAAIGKLEPLDDVYGAEADDSGMTIEEFLNDGIVDYGKVNSNYYAIPWSDSAAGIVYNKTMFETYGWEIPETVDELVELCNTINAAKVPTGNTKQPYVKPFTFWDAYSGYVADTWWAQYEGATNYSKFFDYESPTTFLQQGRVEALKAFEELFFAPTADEYHSFGKKNMTLGVSTHTGAQQDFGNKYAAMIIEGDWLENEASSYLDGSFEYAMMPTPFLSNAIKDETTGDYKQILASQAGSFMCIPSASNTKDGAKEFLKYINSRQGCESYTRSTNGAVRPFEYKASEVEDVEASDFRKSCWNVYENSELVYSCSSAPMAWSGRIGKWAGVGTAVYSGILYGEYAYDADCQPIVDADGNPIPQAITACQKCYDYVVKNWDEIAEWTS